MDDFGNSLVMATKHYAFGRWLMWLDRGEYCLFSDMVYVSGSYNY